MLKLIKPVQEWGNSFGIRLSREELKREEINANDKVEILVRRNVNAVKELFGTLRVKEPTAKIMREIDKAFKSRFD